MALDDKISLIVKNQFPSFYKEDGAKFLDFIKAYYEYMEQQGKSADALFNLKSYKDINETLDEYFKYFQKTLLPNVPTDIAADKRLFAKYISDFNNSRGTLNSYKLLFRALYNEDVELYYPGQQILKVSDGDWTRERYLLTPYDPETYSFIGRTIQGTESSSEALVEDVVKVIARSRDLMKIIVSNVKGEFNHEEPIRIVGVSGGHAPTIEAGINKITVVSGGEDYVKGDVVKLVSDKTGIFGKGVVVGTKSAGGVVSFDLVEGGSGYTTTSSLGGTRVEFIGGDGFDKASFTLELDDIVDTFAISVNLNKVGSNNIFGDLAPNITFRDRANTEGLMSTFANTPIGATHYGFPEDGEAILRKDFHDQTGAVINIANTRHIALGSSLFGNTSVANAIVTGIISGANGDSWFRVNTYRLFANSESVLLGSNTGDSAGTVTDFQANTTGPHVLQIGYFANNVTLNEGDELRGETSGAYAVIKKFGQTVANGFVDAENSQDVRDMLTFVVGANLTSSISDQFVTGPIKAFIEDEPIYEVSQNAYVGNVVSDTSNTTTEAVYTKLIHSLIFKNTTFGTIQRLSNIVGGSGYTIAPRVVVREGDIASLGINESYLRLRSNNEFWATGNSSISKLDSNDKLVGTESGAVGDVKGGYGIQTIETDSYANGSFETWVRVWQRSGQRTPSNIEWKLKEAVEIQKMGSEYIPYTTDTRTPTDIGRADIVEIVDRGILGDNARVASSVGANGIVTDVATFDSGYGYNDGEKVRMVAERKVEDSQESVATGTLTIHDVANTAGYYATNRSHISSLRGYIPDNKYYNEFAYEINSNLPFDKYRDIVLKLVHPAGQGIFAQYRLQSNVDVNSVMTTDNNKLLLANGSIAIANLSSDITGTSTTFLSEYSNSDIMTIEISSGETLSIPLNIVANDTTANTKITWTEGAISSKPIYYNTGSIE